MQVDPRIIPGAQQIADRFLVGRGWLHLGEQVGAQELRELARIAPIGFHAVARLCVGSATAQ